MHLENICFHILMCFLHELAKHLLLFVDSELGIRILEIENELFQEQSMYYSDTITHVVFLTNLIVAHCSNI